MKTETTTRRIRTARRPIPCRVAGCGKGPFKSPQAELMHYHRVHSGRILVGRQKFKPVVSETNGHGKINLGRGRGRGRKPVLATAAAPVVLPQKRAYHKRKKTAEIEILHCPSCLTDLRGVATGMVMAKAKTKVNGCPKCGLDLRIVATGMAAYRPGKE